MSSDGCAPPPPPPPPPPLLMVAAAYRRQRMKALFEERLKVMVDNSGASSHFMSDERYDLLVEETKEAMMRKANREPILSKHYRRLKRFDVMSIGGRERLIEKPETMEDIVSCESVRYFLRTTELFEALEAAHDVVHHKIRVMEGQLKKTYCNINRQVVELYLSLCDQCQMKKIPRNVSLLSGGVEGDEQVRPYKKTSTYYHHDTVPGMVAAASSSAAGGGALDVSDFTAQLVSQLQRQDDHQHHYGSGTNTSVVVPFDELQLVKSSVYVCPVCNKDFYDKAYFRRHYMTHSGEKPYACQYCPYRARQSGTLRQHVFIKHSDQKDEEALSWAGTLSGASFPSSSYGGGMVVPFEQLTLGRRSPYTCPLCSLVFIDKARFRHHYMTHTGEKPYACSYCQYRARQKSTLKQHVYIKHRHIVGSPS